MKLLFILLCCFYAPEGWHIVFQLSVCLSENFNIGHNFCNIEHSNFIFGMHVHLIELHILSGERSSFKVKGQIYGSKSLKRGIVFLTNTSLVRFNLIIFHSNDFFLLIHIIATR